MSGLPREFFARPELTRQEREFLVNLAKEMCMEVIFFAQENGGNVQWKHTETKNGVQIFKGEEFGGNGDLTYVCAVNTIKASLSEVASLFNITSDQKLIEYARVFEPDLIDMMSLYDLATPTEDNPFHYIGVRWSAVESSSSLVKSRDFCYLECQDEFIDTRTGKQGWVRCMHSINMPCCVSLEKSLGYVRGSYYRSGFVFVESGKPGYLDVTNILQVNFKGSVPNWFKATALRQRVSGISRIENFFIIQKLSSGRILGDIELPSKNNVTHCYYCDRKFDMLFCRKFRCRRCGQVVCKKCSAHFALFLPHVGEKKVRICTLCSSGCRDRSDSQDDEYSARGTSNKQRESFHQNSRASRFTTRSNSGADLQPCSNHYDEDCIDYSRFKSVPSSCHASVVSYNNNPARNSVSNRNSVASRHQSTQEIRNTSSSVNSFLKKSESLPVHMIQSGNQRRSEDSFDDTIFDTITNSNVKLGARRACDDESSYMESVNSIKLGSGWNVSNRTDLFNHENFGDTDVVFDTLDREWSKHFEKLRLSGNPQSDINDDGNWRYSGDVNKHSIGSNNNSPQS